MDKALCFELIFRGLRDKYGEAQVIPMFNELNLGRVFDGGEGSGNFNHAGRPGQVGGSARSAEEFFGPAFKEYTGKPEQALEHLLKVKKGYVPAAIYKEGVGHIDFVYGESGQYGYGVAHIIERRNADGFDGVKFVKNIPDLIKNGYVNKQYQKLGRIYIETETHKAVIRLDYNNEDKIWLVTSFKKKKNS